MVSQLHLFHIPVLGLGYSIDTPVKVARYGISSVISIMDDELIEKMRAYHCHKHAINYIPIPKSADDHRARRITAYLNLINDIVTTQVTILKNQSFKQGSEIVKYFEMLPSESPLKHLYHEMATMTEDEKKAATEKLRSCIVAGAIDVNIMAKVDKPNHNTVGNILPSEYSDALSSLRGFAQSSLHSSVIFSAGYNPRLYNYVENFADFFPDEKGYLKKKIILKVSDYRSALVQGKIFAKKGIWISEFRIESGLNCGGHAFATDGLLLGPILEEFKNKKTQLQAELFNLCNVALAEKGVHTFALQPQLKITVQGGIGTAKENSFLLEHYGLDGTGWGSPFLLVPEATNVDDETIKQLATAEKTDYYLSDASPLGVPFNNFRKSSAEKQRKKRIDEERPGSPCYKKYLVSNTEYTDIPICTASRQYQHLKIKQLKERNLPAVLFEAEVNKITEKDCLCEGLSAPALLKNEISLSHNLKAVTICPGPNLAYFSGIFSLQQMVEHIYGRLNLLNKLYRPNMFINELHLYVAYFKAQLEKIDATPKQMKYFQVFITNLLEGIDYYKKLIPAFIKETNQYRSAMQEELNTVIESLHKLPVLLKAQS